MKKWQVLTVVGALASAVALTAAAQPPASQHEVATAHAHALMAQGATSLAMAHTHLHHVVNCIEGTQGKGFDAAAGNPCKGQGHGALADTADNAALHGKVQSALSQAQAGLKANSLDAVHKDAAKVATILAATSAKKASGSHSW